MPTTPTFQLTAALTPPWADGNVLRTCLSDGGVITNTACMGNQLTAINAYLAIHPEIEALNGIALWAKVGWQCEGAGSPTAALAKARQVLNLMAKPVEQVGSVPSSCSPGAGAALARGARGDGGRLDRSQRQVRRRRQRHSPSARTPGCRTPFSSRT